MVNMIFPLLFLTLLFTCGMDGISVCCNSVINCLDLCLVLTGTACLILSGPEPSK